MLSDKGVLLVNMTETLLVNMTETRAALQGKTEL